MDKLLEEVSMFGFEFIDGKSYDCGDKLGYLKANVEYALRDKKLSSSFKDYLADITNTN